MATNQNTICQKKGRFYIRPSVAKPALGTAAEKEAARDALLADATFIDMGAFTGWSQNYNPAAEITEIKSDACGDGNVLDFCKDSLSITLDWQSVCNIAAFAEMAGLTYDIDATNDRVYLSRTIGSRVCPSVDCLFVTCDESTGTPVIDDVFGFYGGRFEGDISLSFIDVVENGGIPTSSITFTLPDGGCFLQSWEIAAADLVQPAIPAL